MGRSRFVVAFGKVVADQRRKAKLTQEGLAERAGLHPTHVSYIETAKKVPTIDVARRIADGIGVKLSKLVSAAETRSNRRTS